MRPRTPGAAAGRRPRRRIPTGCRHSRSPLSGSHTLRRSTSPPRRRSRRWSSAGVRVAPPDATIRRTRRHRECTAAHRCRPRPARRAPAADTTGRLASPGPHSRTSALIAIRRAACRAGARRTSESASRPSRHRTHARRRRRRDRNPLARRRLTASRRSAHRADRRSRRPRSCSSRSKPRDRYACRGTLGLRHQAPRRSPAEAIDRSFEAAVERVQRHERRGVTNPEDDQAIAHQVHIHDPSAGWRLRYDLTPVRDTWLRQVDAHDAMTRRLCIRLSSNRAPSLPMTMSCASTPVRSLASSPPEAPRSFTRDVHAGRSPPPIARSDTVRHR